MSNSNFDTMWVLISCILMIFMQAGFLCLESGVTRAKNSISIAVKNVSDFAISLLLFWMLGFALMFGTSMGGWIGISSFFPEFLFRTPKEVSFFLFQALFATTAVTIVSGSVAERVRFKSYLLFSILVSGPIYTIYGHWAWNQNGWLRELGFIDFAGSSVVHSVGGWVALAAVIVVGPRRGVFTDEGKYHPVQASNPTIGFLGIFLLLIGWIGYNGGSTYAMDERVLPIVINTIFSGAGGLVIALVFGWIKGRRVKIDMIMSGILGGMVAVTASCHAITVSSAIILGVTGGIVAITIQSLLKRFRLDDVVNAVGVHTGAGIWGTLAVALLGDAMLLDLTTTRWHQFIIQLIGVIVCFAWAFGISFICLKILNALSPLRVTKEEEEAGLNFSEHGSQSDILQLIFEMKNQSLEDVVHITEDPFNDTGEIAIYYNQVLDRASQERKKASEMAELVHKAREEADSVKQKLEERVQELDAFNRMAVGREEQMIELKKEINRYAVKMGIEIPYKIDEDILPRSSSTLPES